MSDVVIYDDGTVELSATVENETVWLSQKQMAELLDVKVPAISKHLKNVFASGELDEKVVISKMETTTSHGAIEGKIQTRSTNFYNLDAIISIGYRVNSQRATQFRIWATKILKQYIIDGYALNKDKLQKQTLNEQMQNLAISRQGLENQEFSTTETKSTEETKTNDAKS